MIRQSLKFISNVYRHDVTKASGADQSQASRYASADQSPLFDVEAIFKMHLKVHGADEGSIWCVLDL